MNAKLQYQRLSLNPVLRIEYKLHDYLQNIPINVKSKVSEKHQKFKLLKKKLLVVSIARNTCFVFVYLSIISIFTRQIPLLAELTETAALISGYVGIPIFLIIIYFMQKLITVYIMDAQFIASEIISLVSKTYIKRK